MKYLLWLDDDKEYRQPEQKCPNFGMMYTWREGYFNRDTETPLIWVHNYNEFVKCILENGLPEKVSFDNDLGEKLEGIHCAKWLFDYCADNNLEMPWFSVHSANPIASKEISLILKEDWEKYKS